MNNNGGICVMDVINMLSSLAVDCEFLSKEENSTFNSLPTHFRNTAIGATMQLRWTMLQEKSAIWRSSCSQSSNEQYQNKRNPELYQKSVSVLPKRR